MYMWFMTGAWMGVLFSNDVKISLAFAVGATCQCSVVFLLNCFKGAK